MRGPSKARLSGFQVAFGVSVCRAALLLLETDSWIRECGVGSSASDSNVDIPIPTITDTYPFGVLPNQLWYNTRICPDETSFLFPSLFLFDPKGPVQPFIWSTWRMSADWARKKAADTGRISNAGGWRMHSYEFLKLV